LAHALKLKAGTAIFARSGKDSAERVNEFASDVVDPPRCVD
jgi:hypothetical protein